MRTPWRFVADLVSPKPKVHSREEHPAAASELIALEHQPAITERSVEIAAKERVDAVSPGSDASLKPVQISEETSGPAVDEGSAASADAKDPAVIDAPSEIREHLATEAHTPTLDTLTKPEAMPELKPRKMTRPVVKQPAPLSQTEDKASAVPRSLIDEMTDLDAEIDALRRQLAQRLSEQNAQLRKMLARFDAS